MNNNQNNEQLWSWQGHQTLDWCWHADTSNDL